MSYLPELRSSLVRAADRQRQVPAAARRRVRLPWLGPALAVGVTLTVAAVAIVLVGHTPRNTPMASRARVTASWPKIQPAPPNPSPTPAQWTLIQKARNTVSAHDALCWPLPQLPAYNYGSPDRRLLALLPVLKRPATAADSLQHWLRSFRGLPADLQVKAIRLALKKDGHALYIVPTINPGFRPVPARCSGEERAALVRLSKGAPRAKVQVLIAAQLSYLTWQQYEAEHPAQVCLAEVDYKPGAPTQGAGGLACGWGIAEIEEGVAGLGSEGAPYGQVFHGIVPSGVASVSVVQPRRAEPLTTRVVNNVYLVQLQRGAGNPTRVVWRAADGSVIKTTRVP